MAKKSNLDFQVLSHRAIQLCKNQGPILFQFSMKNTITFCGICAFLFGEGEGVQIDPKVKDQVVWGQVSTTFLEAPNYGLAFGERTSIVAYSKFAFFQL